MSVLVADFGFDFDNGFVNNICSALWEFSFVHVHTKGRPVTVPVPLGESALVPQMLMAVRGRVLSKSSRGSAVLVLVLVLDFRS